MLTPIQIVVTRDRSGPRTDAYIETIRLAFEGSATGAGSPSSYLSEAIDLGIRVLEPTDELDEADAERIVGGARNTIVVVIGTSSGSSKMIESKVSPDHVVRIPAPPDVTSGEIQGEKSQDGVEPAFAPVVAALRAMQRARHVLLRRIGDRESAEDDLKLFISHAKVDGVAMAKSLISVLRQLRESDADPSGFAYFYDDDHIAPGMVWKEVLTTEASRSVLIALRTEAYESRYWCRREFLLAESSGMPILVVDLRNEQYHDCGLLPFDVAPTVRVHDGNLIRVVLHAMAAHLRALRVRSEAPSGVKVLPHRPTVYSLDGGVRAFGSTRVIAYPGPRLPNDFAQAVQPILRKGGSSVDLVTFDELGGG